MNLVRQLSSPLVATLVALALVVACAPRPPAPAWEARRRAAPAAPHPVAAIAPAAVAAVATAPASGRANPFLVRPDAYDFGANPALLRRIVGSPHGYLRFINAAFNREVCRRFADRVAVSPTFYLHGDAHIEQYAVTDLGRGLTDFDDSTTGPAVLDLLRFTVSLTLACEEAGCRDRADEMIDAFLAGYTEALTEPERELPEPRYVGRRRQHFRDDPTEYLREVEALMQPISAAERSQLETALTPYCELARVRHPDLREDFFDLVSCGRLQIGVGSALDLKYLVRVSGESDRPSDDVVLEVKEVRARDAGDCVSAVDGQADRVMAGEELIAYQPFKFVGEVEIDGREFWIHAWVENYGELKIAEAFAHPEEMIEVAHDVGFQLGRGHPRGRRDEVAAGLRRGQMRLLRSDDDRLRAQAQELAALVIEAWELFKETAPAVN